MSLLNTIKTLAHKYYDEVVTIRRYIHQNPELSFQEYNTSKFVCSILDKYSISYEAGIVNTGIVAIIKGKNPDKKTVLLRADLDALPIEEQNTTSYKSNINGVMHACGHDVHTASVLGTAIILKNLVTEFEGTIKVMFQPGEEVLPGGASLMTAEGVLENPLVNVAIAQHVLPSMEVGKVGFRSGMYMASTDELHITIKGRGGHAALPKDYINPLIVAASIIKEVEHQFPFVIHNDGVARNKYNHIPTIVAFGKIEGKGATNVIPDTVYMAGTLRTMDEVWRNEAKIKLTKLINETCIQYNVTADTNIINGYPNLANDYNITKLCKNAAIEYLGNDFIEDLPLRMTAEDFAYITQKVPSCFYRIGTGNSAKSITSALHTPNFDIDEDVFKNSTGLMAYMATMLLRA